MMPSSGPEPGTKKLSFYSDNSIGSDSVIPFTMKVTRDDL